MTAALQIDVPSSLERTTASRGGLPIGATIGLSPRLVTVLATAGINTFQQLARVSDGELLQLENVGYAALCEIRDALHKLGLTAPEPQYREPMRTPLEQELWDLTGPAGGTVERGIAMLHFGWNGRSSIEEIRDRYRVKRDLLRHIFLCVEMQPPPEQTGAIRRVARFIRDHTPMWAEDMEALLITTGVSRQRVTVAGVLNACRIASIDAGFVVVGTPRPLVVPPQSVDACQAIVRTVQHLAAIRGTATIDEVRACVETMTGTPISRPFARRAVALLSNVQWLDHRLGIVTIHQRRGARAEARAARTNGERMRKAS